MPKLVHADVADPGARGESADAVADRLGGEQVAVAADQQRLLIESADALELVVTQRQIRLETAAREVRHGNETLATRLAAIDADQSLLAVPAVDRESLELASTQICAVEKREDGQPQMRSVRPLRVHSRLPQRFHVGPIESPRQARVRRELGTLDRGVDGL